VRLVCGVFVAVVAALLAGPVAAVDVPTLPTVTAPVPLPPLPPPPTVPLPTLPPPPVTVTTPVPTPPAPTPTVPAPAGVAPPATTAPAPAPAPARAAPGQATPPPSQSTSPSAQPSAAAPVATPSAAGSRRAAAAQRSSKRLPLLRPVVGRFHLARAGRVRVRILELAPVCRRLHGFLLKAERGANTLRLPRRVTTLGTYLLTGHRGTRTVFSFRARLLPGRHVRLGGGENVCFTRLAAAVQTIRLSPPDGETQREVFKPPSQPRTSAAPKAIGSSPRNSSPLVRAVTLHDAPTELRPLLLVLLAASILLLGAAAVPQRALPAGPMAAAIATKRAYLAAAGIWLLAIVAIVTTFA
jgi:hypothetical protein